MSYVTCNMYIHILHTAYNNITIIDTIICICIHHILTNYIYIYTTYDAYYYDTYDM
jgi:hypothetical protein